MRAPNVSSTVRNPLSARTTNSLQYLAWPANSGGEGTGAATSTGWGSAREKGSPLAESPPFQASLRARYEAMIGDYKAFWQIGGTHQAHSYSATGNITTYDQAGFSTYDASMGASKDAWLVTLYGQNLTNTRANLFENGNQFVTAETINRPRTAGVKVGYKF